MGYLDNDTVVVDAILTKHGRKLLADGVAINPTHFALADDGVDYTLWNTSSPSGSGGYDDYITKLPMVEAVPDDQTLMRYKLISLNQNTQYMPIVKISSSPNTANSYELLNSQQRDTVILDPYIENWSDSGNEQFIFKISDITALNIVGHDGTITDISGTPINYPTTQDIPTYVEVVNSTFLELSDQIVLSNQSIHITIEHVLSGAITTADITVKTA